MSFFIGLMSGTSMDGIDAVLLDIDSHHLKVVSAIEVAYPKQLRERLIMAIQPHHTFTLDEFGKLDADVAIAFASATRTLLEQANIASSDVVAIGSHGQTIRHSPDSRPPYTLQVGNGAIIAGLAKIDTVSDFRSLDVATGGQGAPLVPAFHEWLFRDDTEERIILNIGGISNITVLPKNQSSAIMGFDTGPGNCLLDEWTQRCLGEPYDDQGRWAASGKCQPLLLQRFLADDYFSDAIPKSTGREKFNLEWVNQILAESEFQNLRDADIQATLLTLTVQSIAQHVQDHAPSTKRIFVCGGGAFNLELIKRLSEALPDSLIANTDEIGMAPDLIEASAFAWFAYCRINNLPVKLSTGNASPALVLGALNRAPHLTN